LTERRCTKHTMMRQMRKMPATRPMPRPRRRLRVLVDSAACGELANKTGWHWLSLQTEPPTHGEASSHASPAALEQMPVALPACDVR